MPMSPAARAWEVEVPLSIKITSASRPCCLKNPSSRGIHRETAVGDMAERLMAIFSSARTGLTEAHRMTPGKIAEATFIMIFTFTRDIFVPPFILGSEDLAGDRIIGDRHLGQHL